MRLKVSTFILALMLASPALAEDAKASGLNWSEVFDVSLPLVAAFGGAFFTFSVTKNREKRSCRLVAKTILHGLCDDARDGAEKMRSLLSEDESSDFVHAIRLPRGTWIAHSSKLAGRVLEAACLAGGRVPASAEIPSPRDFLHSATRYFTEDCNEMEEARTNKQTMTRTRVAAMQESANKLVIVLTALSKQL